MEYEEHLRNTLEKVRMQSYNMDHADCDSNDVDDNNNDPDDDEDGDDYHS